MDLKTITREPQDSEFHSLLLRCFCGLLQNSIELYLVTLP